MNVIHYTRLTDERETFRTRLLDADGNAIDSTNITSAILRYKRPDTGAILERTLTKEAPNDEGWWNYSWANPVSADLPVAGLYKAWIIATWSDLTTETFPTVGTDYISVEAAAG